MELVAFSGFNLRIYLTIQRLSLTASGSFILMQYYKVRRRMYQRQRCIFCPFGH